MTKFYWAHLATSSFTFDAFGATKAEALAALQRGWEKHRKQTGATWTWEDIGIDVGVIAVTPGACLRDRDRLL